MAKKNSTPEDNKQEEELGCARSEDTKLVVFWDWRCALERRRFTQDFQA
jgi:hypothetical protein